MALHKLKMEEIRGFDQAKARETEAEVRRELVNIRMDIYTAKNSHTSTIRGLRKTLARLMTLRTASMKTAAAAKKASKAPVTAAPKAEKAKVAKPAKAAEPKTKKAEKAPKTTAVKAKTSTKKK